MAHGGDYSDNVDPYREFIKVMPQNIMYDRRIVRGNTFAALVIPVSKILSPPPNLIFCRFVAEWCKTYEPASEEKDETMVPLLIGQQWKPH